MGGWWGYSDGYFEVGVGTVSGNAMMVRFSVWLLEDGSGTDFGIFSLWALRICVI